MLNIYAQVLQLEQNDENDETVEVTWVLFCSFFLKKMKTDSECFIIRGSTANQYFLETEQSRRENSRKNWGTEGKFLEII